jgi:hypothetical protein
MDARPEESYVRRAVTVGREPPHWLSDEEFEDCPRCGAHTALTSPTGFVICAECGIVGVRADGRRAIAEQDPD